ncbi:cation transporter [Stappia sp. GBMRC 2046]|uniref:Cation transporter n=2 Tax=Stappia sediminis TaxID=2692190 RepID=A0A7X3S6C9_9HYPH|nr:cation transporter [Stappia sediminis]
MKNSVAIEKRALNIAKWANLVMGFAGIIGAIASRSDALLVDGLYSAVNFLSAIVAGRIAERVGRPPDRTRPWGYGFEETVYVTFRSLTLIGILLFAALSSGGKIAAFATGGAIPELIYTPILIYSVMMVLICASLAAYHHWAYIKSGKTSSILKTEGKAAAIDGAISLGTGIVLLSLPLLETTLLGPYIPIGDALVVLVITLIIFWQPLSILRGAIAELIGASAPAKIVRMVSRIARELASEHEFRFLRVAVQRAGRSHFVVVYIDPLRAIHACEVDDFWRMANARLTDGIGPVQMEVVVTEISEFTGQ